MRRYLLVMGMQDEMIKAVGKKEYERIVNWILGNQLNYDATISIVRKDLVHDHFERDNLKNNVIVNKDKEFYPFHVDQEIEIAGYCPSADVFTSAAQYDIVGISLGDTILSTAFVMFSNNINFRVLTKYCPDRCGVGKEALKILKTYMSTVVI